MSETSAQDRFNASTVKLIEGLRAGQDELRRRLSVLEERAVAPCPRWSAWLRRPVTSDFVSGLIVGVLLVTAFVVVVSFHL